MRLVTTIHYCRICCRYGSRHWDFLLETVTHENDQIRKSLAELKKANKSNKITPMEANVKRDRKVLCDAYDAIVEGHFLHW
jgi:hypothetical protein